MIATRDPFADDPGALEQAIQRADRADLRAEAAERDLAAERVRLAAAQAEITRLRGRLNSPAGRAALGIPEGRR